MESHVLGRSEDDCVVGYDLILPWELRFVATHGTSSDRQWGEGVSRF